MQWRLAVGVAIMLGISGCAVLPWNREKPLLIAEKSAARVQIVIAEGAPPSTRYAAEELQRFLGEITGAEIPIVTDDAPLGVTLTGPAYRDTPIRYANRTFRDITGYSLTDLCGNNPRLLQGPQTGADSVADLREAVSIWEPVSVNVWNHRRDGTAFLNRVSLRPLPGDDGTITHWAAVQEVVRSASEE